MFKALAAAGVACAIAAPAHAGVYINAERNDGWAGSDHAGASTELHIGYEGSVGDNASWYIQGGPAYLTPQGADGETEISGKVGGGVGITDNLSAYVEASFVTGDVVNGYGSKIGAKYKFN
jgi:hypothetical protein